jgi:hypothetical protein
MRPVRTRPRFRCDFCRHTGTEQTVQEHRNRLADWLLPTSKGPANKKEARDGTRK